jgi:hypothetical protein
LHTRAERAAMEMHILGCSGCRAWLYDRREPATPEQHEIHRRQAEQVKERDMADPEFRSVIDGEPT